MGKKLETQNNETIRILHYIPAFQYGGIESFVINLYKNINKDIIQFDFLIETKMDLSLKEKILAMGGQVYEINSIKNIVPYIKEIYHILKENQYKIIHCHSIQTRPIVSIIAKILHIPIRIVHSHSRQFNNKKHILLRKMMQNIAIKCSNHFMACSQEAADFLFKKDTKVKILYNGIEINKFIYQEKQREKIRKELKIKDDETLLIQIGRMTYLKNQQFTLKIMNLLKKSNQYKLLLIGNGEDEENLKQMTHNLQLKNIVIFLGYKKDIEAYLSASDIFLFPSLSEGLGISLIEAQVNGIPCICSKYIPKEVKQNQNVIYLSLEEEHLKEWTDKICEWKDNRIKEVNITELSRFNIENVARQYETYIIKELNVWKQKQLSIQ